mgnify:CR=1 FL=1
MQEIKEILKDKVFNDIKNGSDKMSEEVIEFIKNNFYIWLGNEADRIYDIFKVVYSFDNKKVPFSIKMSKEFLIGYRREYIASTVLNYLDFMNYNEVMDAFVESEGNKFFTNVEDVKEVYFVYDPSSKSVNVATTLLKIEKGDTNDK